MYVSVSLSFRTWCCLREVQARTDLLDRREKKKKFNAHRGDFSPLFSTLSLWLVTFSPHWGEKEKTVLFSLSLSLQKVWLIRERGETGPEQKERKRHCDVTRSFFVCSGSAAAQSITPCCFTWKRKSFALNCTKKTILVRDGWLVCSKTVSVPVFWFFFFCTGCCWRRWLYLLNGPTGLARLSNWLPLVWKKKK